MYKGRAPSKNTQREESDCASFVRKQKRGGAVLPSNPEKGRTGKRNKNDAGHPSYAPAGAKKTHLLHGPRYYSKKCKVLKDQKSRHTATI